MHRDSRKQFTVTYSQIIDSAFEKQNIEIRPYL